MRYREVGLTFRDLSPGENKKTPNNPDRVPLADTEAQKFSERERIPTGGT